MATESEIDRMVVRLTGDDSSYQRMMERAAVSQEQMERSVQQITKAEELLANALGVTNKVAEKTEAATRAYANSMQSLSEKHEQGKITIDQFNAGAAQSAEALRQSALAIKQEMEAEATRQDLMRRGAGLTKSLMTDEENYAARLADLKAMLKATAIEQETFNRAKRQLDSLPGSPVFAKQQKQEEKLQAREEGQRILQKLPVSDEEKYNRVLKEMSDLHQRGGLTLKEFQVVMRSHEHLLPEFAAAAELQAQRSAKAAELHARAERDRTRALQEAQQVARSVRSPEENFRATQGRLRDLVNSGGLSMDDYNKAVEKARQQTPEAQQKRMVQQRIEAISEQTMTSYERHQKRVAELNDLLRDGLPHDAYQRAVRQSAQTVQWAGDSTQHFAGQLMTVGSTLTMVSGIFTATFAAIGHKAVGAYSEAESISMKLNAAIEGGGRIAVLTRPQYEQFAQELERLTTREDDATLAMLQTAESMGLSGDAAMRAVKNATALGAAKGMAAESALRLTIALEEGNAQMLQRHIPALKNVHDQTEKARVAQEALASMFGVAQAEADTFAGKLKILSRDWGNLLEDFGKPVVELLTPLVKKITELVNWVRSWSDETKKYVAYAGLAAVAVGTLVTAAGGLLLTTGALIGSYSALANVLGVATLKQLAFNAAAIANPVGLFVLGASAIAAVAYSIYSANENVQQFNSSLVKSAELGQKIADVTKKKTESIVAESRTIESPDERTNFLSDMADQATRDVASLEKALRSAKQEAKDAAPSFLSLWQYGSAEAKRLQVEADNVTKQLEAMKDRATKLREELLRQGGHEKIQIEIDVKQDQLKDLQIKLFNARNEAEAAKQAYQQGGSIGKWMGALIVVNEITNKVRGIQDDVGEMERVMGEAVSATLDKASDKLDQLKTKMRHLGMTDAEVQAEEVRKVSVTMVGDEKAKADKLVEDLLKTGKDLEDRQVGVSAFKQLEKDNEKLDEQRRLWGLVGIEKKRAETDILAEKLQKRLIGVDDPKKVAEMLRENDEMMAKHRAGIEAEDAFNIQNNLDKRTKEIELIGLKGLELEKARRAAQKETALTPVQEQQFQKNLDDEGLKKYLTSTQEATRLMGLYGAELEFARMEVNGLFAGMTDVEKATAKAQVAATHNANAIAKINAETQKQKEMREGTGFERFARQNNVQVTDANRPALIAAYVKAETEATAVLIQKKSDELKLIGLKGLALEEMQRKIDKKPAYTADERAMRAEQLNSEAVLKSKAALEEKLKVLNATGIAAYALAVGFDYANSTEKQRAELAKAFELQKQVQIGETIKKLGEEAAVLGKTGFEAFVAAEKFKGITFSDEQLTRLKKAFDSNEVAKLNEKFGDPMEKYRKAVAHIEDLRRQGLNDRAYMEMLREAREEINKVAGTHTIKFNVEGVEAVAVGSAKMERALLQTRFAGVTARMAAANNVVRRVNQVPARNRNNLPIRPVPDMVPQNNPQQQEKRDWNSIKTTNEILIHVLDELKKIERKPAIVFEEANLV